MRAERPSVALAASRVARLDDVVRHHSAARPGAPCMTFGERHWTWFELETLVERASRALMARGIQAGDRVAVLSTPRPEYLVMLLAVSRARAVYVGLNPRYTAAELRHTLGLVRPGLIVSLQAFEGKEFGPLLDQATAGSDRSVPVLLFSDLEQCLDRLERRAFSLDIGGALGDRATPSALDQAAAIVFTSGSTGRPKAALLSHRGLLRAAAVQSLRLNPPNPSQARYLSHLPINHVGCLMNLSLGPLIDGGSVVFLERFSAEAVLDLLSTEAINCWLQVPAMFHACTQSAAFRPERLGGLHSICIGGGAVSEPTLSRLREIGVPIYVEYGQTESSSTATYSPDGAVDEVLLHSVGRFDSHFEFRIANPDGTVVPPGQVGEIQGRGDIVFLGYFEDPVATAEAFTSDGWLRTGDLGLERGDGCIELKGRIKEMIKSGGYNVYPREVELVLEEHPAVGQVVVVGRPDERFGEAVHAVVHLRRPAETRELADWCRQRLANYKVPKTFLQVESFPLLSNGKIDRMATRLMVPQEPPSAPPTSPQFDKEH